MTVAKAKAAEENLRLDKVAIYEANETEREAHPDTTPCMAKPVTDPIQPPHITANFTCTERPRGSAVGSHENKTSADPARLRDFADRIRLSNGHITDQLDLLVAAWTNFLNTCPWVPIDSATFVGGMELLIAENEADCLWAIAIAEAFEAAGGGELADVDLGNTVVASLKGIILPEGDGITSLSWALSTILAGSGVALEWFVRSKWSTIQLRYPAGTLNAAGEPIGGRWGEKISRNLWTRMRQGMDKANYHALADKADLVKLAGKIGKGISATGYVITGATTAINQWNEDSDAGFKTSEKVGRTTAMTAATVGGAVGGTLAGAKIGLAIGSMIMPGAGSAVGTLLGGVIGGAIGSGVGEKVGKKFRDGAGFVADKVCFWD